MKIEIKGNLRVLIADSGYLTQNTDAEIENRIFVKQKMLLPNETESDYKEVAEIQESNTESNTEIQTLEARVTDIEQVTAEVFEQLNDKGLI